MRVARLVLMLAGVLPALLPLAGGAARAGQIVPMTFHSDLLGRDWNSNVYLPDGYQATRPPYPVLYLLHGIGGDRDDWVVKGDIAHIADALIAAAAIRPCLIVMPSGRRDWYLDGAEPMETAVIDELIPQVERQFHASSERADRMIGGASMGGYGALRFALRYPDLFAAAALLSPAIYDPLPPERSASRTSDVFMTDGRFDPARWRAANYPALLDRFRATGMRLPLFVAAGSEDELHIGGHVHALARLWRHNHWPGTFAVLPGHHDFAMWRQVLPQALRFLFGHDGPGAATTMAAAQKPTTVPLFHARQN